MGPEYFDAWETLQEAYEYSPVLMRFVPIDRFDRDDYLAMLGQDLGIKFDTDWGPIGMKEDGVLAPPINLSSVFKLDVVKQFYEG